MTFRYGQVDKGGKKDQNIRKEKIYKSNDIDLLFFQWVTFWFYSCKLQTILETNGRRFGRQALAENDTGKQKWEVNN